MNAPPPARPPTWPARLVQIAIIVVVTAVAAATFVLSYGGVHAIALQSGVPAKLARFYPAVFDAVLVIACAAVPLRTRWVTRGYTWFVVIVVAGILGTLDAVHAMNVTIPRRSAAGIAAVLPWILLLMSFSLWLAILRHFRAQQFTGEGLPAAPGLPVAPGPPALPAGPGLPGLQAGPGLPGLPAGPELPADAATGGPAADVPDAAPGGPVAEPTGSSGPSDELSGAAGADGAAADEGSGDLAVPPDEGAAGLAIPEVPGVPYATGPRLRRVRSLPAPPVDDGGDEEGVAGVAGEGSHEGNMGGHEGNVGSDESEGE